MSSLCLGSEMTMAKFALSSFQVKGFRALKDLRLDWLRRTNLIVGRNNVGKTYLLEAIRLYVNRGAPWLLREMITERDETPSRDPQREAPEEVQAWVEAFENLFHGRQRMGLDNEPICVGSIEAPSDMLKIALVWCTERTDEQGIRRHVVASPSAGSTEALGLHPAMAISVGEGLTTLLPIHQLEEPMRRWFYRTRNSESIPLAPCFFVPSGSSVSGVDIGGLWDRVVLTELEDSVIAALRIVEPRIERITLVGEVRQRTILVKLVGQGRPVSLRSMGEGMNRLFGLILALVNAKEGVLLWDEVENGFHYTVLPDLWRLVVRTARELNVQVFATTHSWDCIEAFQAATQDDAWDDAMLIRLEPGTEGVRTVVFDRDELGVIAREQIEVR